MNDIQQEIQSTALIRLLLYPQNKNGQQNECIFFFLVFVRSRIYLRNDKDVEMQRDSN